MRRARWLAALAVAACAACAPLTPPPAATGALRLIGTAAIPPGTEVLGSAFGGISGIDYDARHGRWLLISDDRSVHAPARIYTAHLRYSATHLAPPELTGVHTLLHASGRPFAPPRQPVPGMDVPDPESARWLPGTGHFLWTSEGDFARGFGPQLRESRADGTPVRDIPLPPSFMHGPRGNGTLEGLALVPGTRTAWLAMERPWRQDGPPAAAPVRITAIDVDSGRPLRQIAYQPDTPHERRLPFGPRLNGVSEILADGPHHLLVLERAYAAGNGFAARLYRIDTRESSDTLALDSLAPGNHRPAPKTLVADFAALGLTVDNLEGMAWGPPLPGGGCVLVFVSDDNFNPAQATQFIAAEYLARHAGQGGCGTTAP